LAIDANFKPNFAHIFAQIANEYNIGVGGRTCGKVKSTRAISVFSGVRSMNEAFALERVNEAYERMLSGKASFRDVLTTGNYKLSHK
jgi:D-arabinose 1-dehydrogenase-like Zn-dependent alcohol dehydrogenase